MIKEICRQLILEIFHTETKQPNLQTLLSAYTSVGLNRDEIEEELAGVVSERIALHLLGQTQRSANFIERKHRVYLRLKNLLGENGALLDPDGLLVRAVTRAQGSLANASAENRQGIRRLESKTALDLLELQGFRCATCGIPLRESTRRRSTHFASGLEPTGKESLDHKTPFYLVGNDTEYEILCTDCNSLKNDYIGVQEDGLVLTGNSFRPRDRTLVTRRMCFWRLRQRGGCEICHKGPTDSCMFTIPQRKGDPLSYDNMMVVCTDHADTSAYWLHSAPV